MVTRERIPYAVQAMRYFLGQSYTNKELVIVESGSTDLSSLLPDDQRIRYYSTTKAEPIGTLRNRACALARGDIIVLWDDDDWHGPHRLSRQTAAINCNVADMTALRGAIVFDLVNWQFWRCDTSLHQRVWTLDVQGGTLAFRRSVWERLTRFPDTSVADDAWFLLGAMRLGATLKRLDASRVFLYVRHGTNTFYLRPGSTGGRRGWYRANEPRLSIGDREFYAHMRRGHIQHVLPQRGSWSPRTV